MCGVVDHGFCTDNALLVLVYTDCVICRLLTLDKTSVALNTLPTLQCTAVHCRTKTAGSLIEIPIINVK